MTDVLIVGGGGMAREAEWLAREAGFTPIAFVVPTVDHSLPMPCIDEAEARRLTSSTGIVATIAIGNPVVRRRIAEELHLNWTTISHPSARIGPRVTIGNGTMVCAGVVITCDVHIGRHVLLNIGCTITHDCVIGDYSAIAPGANVSGNTIIGETCLIGTNASIIERHRIGSGAIIGAGAVVTRDVADGAIIVGNPGRARDTL